MEYLEQIRQKYNAVVYRIDNSEEYFSNLSDDAIEIVEESKQYKALLELIVKANELYLILNPVDSI
ncbi:hypothetical protein KQI18_12100 [Clostridioides mangenotii]|uniref:hypothetical protein n=1 Tax=Metaclostridioides mangenotii TaxID=1540 RepID=UPI001C114C8C|nr:hypothetical protein [Clostridioides mangenotii]MBU5308519.1 hypothetical protein [Clostridioides mangenotii]